MSPHHWHDARRGEEPPFADLDRRSRQRSEGERDRDRVLYSSAFQRLAGITQVVPAGAGQAVHSRLTHSLKVAQVARRLCQRLLAHHEGLADELDADAVEASALVHDLGHPPFGHIAEKELDKFACGLAVQGGFEGNAQSFRLVTRLAQRWPADDEGDDRIEYGLNLTRRTLDGILKYPWLRDSDSSIKDRKWGAYEADQAAFAWVRERRSADVRSPAAEIMDWADDLTYAVHDMEDFYRAGLIPLERLCTSERERERFKESFRDGSGQLNERLRKFDGADLDETVSDIFVRLDFVDPYSGTRSQRQILRERTSFLIAHYMHALDLEGDGLVVEPVRELEVAVLKELTWFYVINRQELATVQEGQRRVIERLCDRYWRSVCNNSFHLFPPLEQEALRESETPKRRARIVCDFIARLPEARALELHQRIVGHSVPMLGPASH